MAEINISKGYRFTGATGAANLLGQMKNPVPDGLVGILAPESGQWWVVLTYRDIGYIKGADKSRIDAATILKSISDRAERQNEGRAIHGLPPIDSVNWKLAPTLNTKTHTVEWAVLAKTQSSEVINHTICLLGREGVLNATVVEPYHSGLDLAPLKELVKNISFNPGQRYTDYQKGDTVAQVGLDGLIMGKDESVSGQQKAGTVKTAGSPAWYVYAGVGALAGATILIFRGKVRRRGHKRTRRASFASSATDRTERSAVEKHEHSSARADLPAAAAVGNGNGAAFLKSASSTGNGVLTSRTDIPKTRAVVKNGSNHHHGRRKKVFDYHRFYTETVMKLSSGAYTGVTERNGRTKSDTNVRVAGHPSRSLDGVVESQPPTQGDKNQAFIQAHLDLIANQKELIEEQKRLMIQQARLIEEKSKLLAEKTHLLDRQTELFERDLL